MSEPFIGQIMMFGGNFAPRGWALCDGQLMSIAQNSALFSILGTTYGGDGVTTFGLPDLRGRFPMHPGNGPGLSPRRLGDKTGAESVTLTTEQLPPHSHPIAVEAVLPEVDPATPAPDKIVAYNAASGATPVQVPALAGNTGGGQSVPTLPPMRCVNFIIALQGIFPSRS
ncbi:MAG: phage tail protein [Deltaproteobacteria bacterium]|nr:MAG: phage tail protein [Deltaproteobacteria bacterium]